MKKPIIGITPLFNAAEPLRKWMSNTYFDAIENAGGIPIMLPWYTNRADIARALEIVDGVVVAGGNDVSPLIYGENVLEECGDILPDRDEFEMAVAKYAYKNKIPLLGICRGCQLINVAMGGSLYQDIPSQLKDSNPKIIHSQKTMPNDSPFHSVKISKDSILYDCLGQEEILVNSFHHQAAKAVAPGFFASAHSQDGLIEALEPIVKDRFFLGVQWHPEMMFRKDENSRRVFRCFLDYIANNQ